MFIFLHTSNVCCPNCPLFISKHFGFDFCFGLVQGLLFLTVDASQLLAGRKIVASNFNLLFQFPWSWITAIYSYPACNFFRLISLYQSVVLLLLLLDFSWFSVCWVDALFDISLHAVPFLSLPLVIQFCNLISGLFSKLSLVFVLRSDGSRFVSLSGFLLLFFVLSSPHFILFCFQNCCL